MTTHERIETRELVITDDEGRQRIKLGTSDGMPSIQLFDKYGTARIRLRLDASYDEERECPEIELLNDEGEWLASLGVQLTSETPQLKDPALYEGDMRYEEPHLFLAARTGESLSAIDVMLHGNEPMLLIQRAGASDKHSLSIDSDGNVQVKKNPFD